MTVTDPQRDEGTRRLWEQGRAVWPAIALGFEAFLPLVTEQIALGASPGEVAKLNGPDLFIACACLAGVRGAAEALDAAFWPDVSRQLGTLLAEERQVNEFHQALLIKLLTTNSKGTRPKLAEYSGRGPLRAWLKVTAKRVAISELRGGMDTTELTDSYAGRVVSAAHDPEVSLIRGLHHEDFSAALSEGLDALAPANRLALKMHYREQLNMDELALALRTSRSGAHRRLDAARQELIRLVRGNLRARTQLGPETFESLLRLLNTSLGQALTRELLERLG